MLKVARVFLHVQCQPCTDHGTRSMPIISAMWNGSRLGCRDGATIKSQICDHSLMSACSNSLLHNKGWNSNMSTIHMQTSFDIIPALLKTASPPPNTPTFYLHLLVFLLQVWEFSSLFSSVNRWSFSNIPSVSDHLKSCFFYQREEHTEPVALACLGELRHK